MDTPDKETLNTILFFQLVTTFQNAAWQQLGKRVNPITQKTEKDFEQASLSIGMLDMLLIKTEGNLSDEESRFLTQAVSDLKLNYVEEVNKADTETEPEPEDIETKEEETAAEEKPKAATADKKEKTGGGTQKKAKSGGEKKRKKA